jgi:hypothetical protein
MLYFQAPSVSREEAMRVVNNCKAIEVSKNAGEDKAKFAMEKEILSAEDKEKGSSASVRKSLAINDFDAAAEAALAAQERCGYEFGIFDGQYVSFTRRYHRIYITVDKAAELLNSCVIKTVSYRNPADMRLEYTTGSPTGVELLYKEKPQIIDVKDELMRETLPTFREAKKKCPDIEIIVNGQRIKD